jgi:hypothetical protein
LLEAQDNETIRTILRGIDMPKVKPKETRSHYVHRAVAEIMKEGNITQKAAVGKAEGMYDHAKKKKEKK